MDMGNRLDRNQKLIGMIDDNPQEQGITVAPLNVEEGYRSAGAGRKSYLFPTTKVSQVLVDCA